MYESQIKKQVAIFIGRLSVVIMMLVLAACGDSMTEAQMTTLAKGYMTKGQVSNAAIEIKNALQKNPDNAEARYLLAMVNMTVGDYASAEKDFKRAETLGWNLSDSVIGELRAQVELRKFTDVIDRVIDVKIWPIAAQANAQALKAVAHASSGDMVQAKNALSFAQKLDAKAYNVMKVTVQFQLLEKQFDAAKATLEQALKNYPDDIALLLLRANLEVLEGGVDKALASYQQIIANDNKKFLTPGVRAAHIGVMKLAVATKDYELVEQTKKILLKSNKNDYEAFYLIAVAAFEQNKYEEANEYVGKILNRSERHAPSLLLAGSVNFAQKNFEQAAQHLSMYVTDNPDNAKAKKLLGRIYMALGQHDNAQETFGSVLKKTSKDAELVALMGLSEISSGQVESGIEELEKALELAPESSSLRLELAKAYALNERTTDAIELLDAVLAKGDVNHLAQSMKVFTYVQAKNFGSAISEGQVLLEASPDNAEALSLMGAVYVAVGDAAKARDYFNQALAVNDTYVKAIISLAQLDEVEEKYESAQSRYLAILEKSPNDTGSMISLARLAAKKGDAVTQVEWLQKAREADKTQLLARVALAELGLADNNLSEVEVLLGELKNENASHPAVLAIEGRLLMVQKRHTQASDVFEKLIKVQPKLDLGYYLLAQNQISLNDLQGALSNLRKAYSLNSGLVRNIVLLAKAELSTGNFERALVLGKKVSAGTPDSLIGYFIQGDALRAQNKNSEALAAYDDAWSIKKNSDVLIRRFSVARKLEKNNQANSLLTNWLLEHPNDSNVHLALASDYNLEGKYEDAIKHYEMTLKGLPDNVQALNNLAWLYRNDNKVRALELSERAYRIQPDVAGIVDTYGWVLLNADDATLGQLQQASRLLKQAMEDLPELAEVRYHYAVSLLKTGKVEDAKAMLKSLLESGEVFDGKADAKDLLR